MTMEFQIPSGRTLVHAMIGHPIAQVKSPEITPWLAGARERVCRIQTAYEMTLGQFKLMGRHMGISFEEADG